MDSVVLKRFTNETNSVFTRSPKAFGRTSECFLRRPHVSEALSPLSLPSVLGPVDALRAVLPVVRGHVQLLLLRQRLRFYPRRLVHRPLPPGLPGRELQDRHEDGAPIDGSTLHPPPSSTPRLQTRTQTHVTHPPAAISEVRGSVPKRRRKATSIVAPGEAHRYSWAFIHTHINTCMHVEHWGRWASSHGDGLKKNISSWA